MTQHLPRHFLTPRPPAFSRWTADFMKAVQCAGQGDSTGAERFISRIDGLAIAYWYHLTAQNAAGERIALLTEFTDTPAPARETVMAREQTRMPNATERIEILKREHWRCWYCGSPLLSKVEFYKLQGIVGPETLPFGKTNLTTHGAKFLHMATFDHVRPHNRGGLADRSNIVASCYACNFGKYRYTMEELGLENTPDGLSRYGELRSWTKAVSALRN